MAKKRAHNEGSIYQRSNGKWRAQITIDGRRLSNTTRTKQEGLTWIHDTRDQITKGLTFKATDTKLKEFLSEWLKTVALSNSKSTHVIYGWTVRKHITPFIGEIRLMDLKPDQVQRYYHRLQADGLSNHAVHVSHKILRTALNHAVKLGLVGRNPCSGAVPPKPEHVEMKFYDDQQVKLLLKTALKIEDRFYPLYYLAIHTGMRQGELLGLKWEDIDWKLKSIQVKRQVKHFKGENFTFTEVKSKSGNRTIRLGKQALAVLKDHQREQQLLLNSSGSAWANLNLVFPSSVGTPVTASNIRRAFRKLLEASGLPKIRFHDLRHTAASLMLNHGIPVLIVSKRLGHSKPSITIDVYGHLIPSQQEEAAQLMDDLMFDG